MTQFKKGDKVQIRTRKNYNQKNDIPWSGQFIKIRVTEQQKQIARRRMAKLGFVSLSEMIRAFILAE